MMRTKLFVLILLLSLPTAMRAQDMLQSGPMVGYSDMRETMLWVQTRSACTVQFWYVDSADAHQQRRLSTAGTTSAATAFTAHCVCDSVEPGRRYYYGLMIDGQQVPLKRTLTFRTAPLWQWRGSLPSVRVALGSCTYINEEQYDRPGTPYGGGYQIFERIAAMKPDIMLWLGDNTYLRESDWNSRSGIFKRHTHTRSLPELQQLLGSTVNYAIWDDHDYGPNDSDRGFANKEQTYEAFKLFWANHHYGMDNVSGGINSTASWGDVDFFFLDNRWWRSPDKSKSQDRTILGARQFEWLIDNLSSSTATFKVVCIGGQVLNSAAVFENYATYADERKRLIDAIHTQDISGVVFVDGDRHHAELSVLKEPGHYPMYDLTTSPLTAGVNMNAASETNVYRIPGTLVRERNFALIECTGAPDSRTLTLSLYNSDGKQLWKHVLSMQDLITK